MAVDLANRPLEAPRLSQDWSDWRAIANALLTVLVWIVALLASVPLFSVLYMLIWEGGARLAPELFTELPPAGFEEGGGFGNAILGTLVMVAIAAVISVPLGVLAAVYLSELSPDLRLSRATRFLTKVLTGFPSILAGDLRIRSARARDGHLLGSRGWCRSRHPDDADRHFDGGRSA